MKYITSYYWLTTIISKCISTRSTRSEINDTYGPQNFSRKKIAKFLTYDTPEWILVRD